MKNEPGLHIISTFDGPLVAPNGAKPTIVKVFAPPDAAYIRQIRAKVGPACLIDVRFEEPETIKDPIADAEDWFRRHEAEIKAMTDNGQDIQVAFEGVNEISVEASDQQELVSAYEIRRMELMHPRGYRCIVGNFSPGQPPVPFTEPIVRMIRAMKSTDAFGMHSRWADEKDIDNIWHFRRWMLSPELYGVRVIATESGREYWGDTDTGGPWQWTCSKEQYLKELRLAADKYPDVLQATYTGGRILDPKWGPYDVNAIWPDVVAGYTLQPEAPPTTPPPVQPPKPVFKLYPILRKQSQWMVSRPFGFVNSEGTHLETDLIHKEGGTEGAAILCPFEEAVVDIVSWKKDREFYVYLYDPSQDVEVFFRHLQIEPLITPGQRITRGQPFATVGNAGIHVGFCTVAPTPGLPILEWIDIMGERVKWLLP